MAKNLPAMQETWILFLVWKDPLMKGTGTHSIILDWRILYSPWGRKDTTFTFTILHSIIVYICVDVYVCVYYTVLITGHFLQF